MDSGDVTAEVMKQPEKRRQWWEFDEGVYVAVAILTCWALMVHHTVFHVTLPSVQAFLLFLPMMQLHTGVFITAHEAMHGSVAPSNPALNDFFGRLACTLYAGFDFENMRKNHKEHHAHTGLRGKDPDFHDGNPSLVAWLQHFMGRYLGFWQVVRLNIMVAALQFNGAPYLNMVVFLLCAGLSSGLQLFYYGTYLPHRPPESSPDEVMNWQKARSSGCKTRVGSILTCYHFDCHYEHHANPRAPWFKLWDARKQRLRAL